MHLLKMIGVSLLLLILKSDINFLIKSLHLGFSVSREVAVLAKRDQRTCALTSKSEKLSFMITMVENGLKLRALMKVLNIAFLILQASNRFSGPQ